MPESRPVALTGLGMVIGTASVILVVTISLTSRNYILEQIEGVGSNMIYASYAVGSPGVLGGSQCRFQQSLDIQAVRQQLARSIAAAAGIESNYDATFISSKEERLLIIGSDEYYKTVRNLAVLSGRFLDASDVELPPEKVALMTEETREELTARSTPRQASSSNCADSVRSSERSRRKRQHVRAIGTKRRDSAHPHHCAAILPSRGTNRPLVRAGSVARAGRGR